MELQKPTQSLTLWKNALQKSATLQLYSSKQKMLVSQKANDLTIQDALDSGAHFSVLRKWNEPETIASMTQLLTELLMFVPNSLTGDQIVYMAESIVIDNEMWKPDDILIILRNGKQGRYGKIYGNFSYQTFNEWADAYAKEREAHIHNAHLSQTEKNNVTEGNKHEINRERQGQVNGFVTLKDYLPTR
jgi:hypothetical protein